MAKACFETGRTDDANHNLDVALQLATTLNDPYMLAAIHLLKGDVKLKLGKNEDAEREYLDALSLAQANHFGEFEMEALRGAYECTKDSQPKRALAYFTQSAALKDSIYNKEQQALIRDFEVQYKMEEKEHELALQQEKNRQSRRLLSLSVAVALLLLVLLIVGLRVAFLRKRRNEMKDQMLFVVAHDIKTPVVSQVQLLDMTCEHYEDMPKEEIKENIEALKMSTDDLKDKLQNIIYWVRNEMGGLSSEPTPFGISALVDEVVQELSLQVRLKGLSVANEVPAEWMAFDDEKAVRTVLQNLLSNAVKFSYPQGIVNITATEANGCYRLTVTDHGRGIAKERMTLLLKGFAPYSQGTEGEVGTGIGLFVSQQLLSRNGGKITIESQEGQGTSVSFTIKKAQ